MSKKKHKWISKKKNGNVEKRESFIKKEGKPLVSPMSGDRVRLNISPIIIPALPNVRTPFTDVVHGVEFQVQHAPSKHEDQRNEEEFSALHVAADHAGCGWWRFHEIEDMVNYTKRGYVINSGLRFNREYFMSIGFDAIRMQRQVGPGRFEYWSDIKQMINEMHLKTRLIFELDDIVIGEKMPDYNEAKSAFSDKETVDSLHKMLELVDELTVVSPYMRQLYRKHHQTTKISVIPNFASRSWFDGRFDLDRRMKEYEKHKKRPRILLSGGATHVNPYDHSLYGETDYTKCVDSIISARRDFEFVIMGVLPPVFRAFIESGEMIYVPWANLPDYPRRLNELDVQCSIAPLSVNDFNRAKSSIKWQEACYMGFGFAGQDLDPYAEARHRFNVGEELIDILKSITKDEQSYQEEIEFNRKSADKYWLDDKINDIITIYKTPYGDPKREKIKWFVDLNPAQFYIQKKS